MSSYEFLLENYKIKERVADMLKTMTIDKAISKCESELSEINNIWSECSYDCIGHAHTCLRLKIDYLKTFKM